MNRADLVKHGIHSGTAFLFLTGMTIITGVIVILMALQAHWNRITVGGRTHEIESTKAAVASSTVQRVKRRDLELKALENFDQALRRFFADHFVERPTAVAVAIDAGERVRRAWFDSEVTGTPQVRGGRVRAPRRTISFHAPRRSPPDFRSAEWPARWGA